MADAKVTIRGGAGNAVQIQSRAIDAAAPSDTNVLAWSASDSEWEPTAAGGGGVGDVVGPSSSVDDRIVTFDSTTGKLVQDGGKTIADVESGAASGWTPGVNQVVLSTSTDKVGIGAPSPAYALEVNDAVFNAQFAVTRGADGITIAPDNTVGSTTTTYLKCIWELTVLSSMRWRFM